MYVDVSSYSVARGESGYVRTGDDRERVDLFPDHDINQQLGTPNMAHITRHQVQWQCVYCCPKKINVTSNIIVLH